MWHKLARPPTPSERRAFDELMEMETEIGSDMECEADSELQAEQELRGQKLSRYERL